jgi:hypothetical protein
MIGHDNRTSIPCPRRNLFSNIIPLAPPRQLRMRWESESQVCAAVNVNVLVTLLPSTHTLFSETELPFGIASYTLRFHLNLGTK